MNLSRFASLATLTLCVTAASVAAHAGNAVPGEKLDSGLGELPHYSQWARASGRGAQAPAALAVPGESLDDGLAALPHYSLWKDPTGKDPLGLAQTLLSAATR